MLTAPLSLAGESDITGMSSGRIVELDLDRISGFRKFLELVPLGLITCRSLELVSGLDSTVTDPGLTKLIGIGVEELRDGSAEELVP